MQLGGREEVDGVRKERPRGKLMMNLDGILLKGVDKEYFAVSRVEFNYDVSKLAKCVKGIAL